MIQMYVLSLGNPIANPEVIMLTTNAPGNRSRRPNLKVPLFLHLAKSCLNQNSNNPSLTMSGTEGVGQYISVSVFAVVPPQKVCDGRAA